MDEKLNELFNSNSVGELQKIVRNKRHDVERKKDELRFLVGERHRDVIEASDAIKDMKQLSENVSGSTIALKDQCISLNVPPQLTLIPSECSKLKELYVAAHLKLLLDIPEMIWNFMDNGDHLSAVIIFLFGRHISARLQLSSQLHSAGIDARVLVKRLWNSLVHMESAVVAACRRRLAAPPSTWKELCNSLVALVLVEKVPMLTAIEEYLDGRMAALRRIFCDVENIKLSNADSKNGNPPLPIRRQAILVSKHMISTLNSAEILFYKHPDDKSTMNKGAVQCELENLRNWSLRDAKWLPTERLYTYLSDDVRTFCLADVLLLKRSGTSSDEHIPILPNENVDMSVLQDRLVSWWNQSLEYCRARLQISLSHAPNFSALVSIRYVTLSYIKNWPRIKRTEPGYRVLSPSVLGDTGHTWFQTHDSPDDASSVHLHPLLQRPVNLWTELFRDPFLTRITVLFNTCLDNYFEEWATQVLQLVKSTSELEPLSSDKLNPPDLFSWNPFSKGFTDWAKYVWTDSKLDSFRTVNDDRASSCPTSTPDPNPALDLYTTAGLTRILRPENAGLIVFCCLTGHPFPSSIVKDKKTFNVVQSPPAHLLVFLQRLLSASPASIWVKDSQFDSADRYTSSNQGHKSANLSHQLSLFSPRLQEFCEAFNTRITNLIVQIAEKSDEDWLQLWTVILEGMDRLLSRCQKWITLNAYQDGSGENSGNNGENLVLLSTSRGLVLSRACSAFVDLCPAIGASVITAIGLIQSTQGLELRDNITQPGDSKATRSFTWSDTNFLRTSWGAKREPLLSLADRLMVDCLVKATVNGPPLVSFRHLMQSTFGLDVLVCRSSPTEPQTDDAPPLFDFLWDEEDVFGGGFDLGTVPFDCVNLQSDSAQLPDSNETVDREGVAVLRVPSQISLPLHRTLLTVVYLIVRLAVHTSPRYGSIRKFCLTLGHALLTEYAKVVHQFESLNNSDQPALDGTEAPSSFSSLGSVIQPRALQLIVDIQFILKLLVWPICVGQSPSILGLAECHENAQLESDVQSIAKQLLSRLETFVDPFDWEVCSPLISTGVAAVLNGIAHLYTPLMHQSVGSQMSTTTKVPETSSASNLTTTDSKSQSTTMLMPLLNASSTGNCSSFTTLPLGLASCFDKHRCKSGSTTRSRPSYGELSTPTVCKSSSDVPLSTSKPTLDSGFIGSMWFSG